MLVLLYNAKLLDQGQKLKHAKPEPRRCVLRNTNIKQTDVLQVAVNISMGDTYISYILLSKHSLHKFTNMAGHCGIISCRKILRKQTEGQNKPVFVTLPKMFCYRKDPSLTGSGLYFFHFIKTTRGVRVVCL